MSKLITVNLSYYNQSKEILLKHVEYWKSYPKEIRDQMTFFIIDDCSKIHISELIKKENLGDLDVVIYRVKIDLVCNIAGIRNLGAKQCKTPWYVIIDMDTLIPIKMASQLIKLAKDNMEKNNTFKFNRKVINNRNHEKNNIPHPAVCLIRISDYWNIGGNEEDLVGSYGKTDGTFYFRASGKVNVIIKEDIYVDYFEDGESNINRDTSRNSKIASQKMKSGKWSTDYVRFPWEKVIF